MFAVGRTDGESPTEADWPALLIGQSNCNISVFHLAVPRLPAGSLHVKLYFSSPQSLILLPTMTCVFSQRPEHILEAD